MPTAYLPEQLHGKLYQIEDDAGAKKVTVEGRVSGSLHIVSNTKSLKYKEITERPKKKASDKMPPRQRKPYVPPKDHQWRQRQKWKPLPERRAYACYPNRTFLNWFDMPSKTI
ncbi:MAG: hypothetical protein JRC68_08220 [Deltaproteobacteria bacterium]|nr:hypothetical protein [Deltaproteobacteria bacterium]